MVYLQTKNSSLAKFWMALESVGIIYGHSEHLNAICYTLWPFGIFCCHLVYFSRIGMPYQEKSGNPAWCETKITALM
jgi:hypothetical protein